MHRKQASNSTEASVAQLDNAGCVLQAGLELRDCRYSDYQELARMEEEYYREVDLTETYDEGKFRDEFTSSLYHPRKKIFVAHFGGEIAGFIWLEEFDEPDGILGYISNIHVVKKYRNRGVGKYLLGKAEEYFKSKGIRRLQLEVVDSNMVALHLYSRFGYTPLGDYMEKKLT